MTKAANKIGARCVPVLLAAFVISYLDRVNVGFAALTMNQDLGFSPAVYGNGAGILFLGYFLFQVPSNMALGKFGTRAVIMPIMILWGAVSMAMAFVETSEALELAAPCELQIFATDLNADAIAVARAALPGSSIERESAMSPR